ncbi:hypothetical protein GCM10012275_28180 [Longimycelium tulufanense]|uniref:DUF5047 domain-containing protein n=1 Tax=Longimycelium tulufanense TaxID=907463 RepID=A0A8J3FWR7_9PSEU|nr:DUF5047 domain-containing protein [Longimycelium tulufanense]GGM55428.1 hypothetical protein GCM10012275_28180 [Longimycelium tulufanense]
MPRQSDRFYTEIRRSHHPLAFVEAKGINGEVVRLTVKSGDVSVDRTASPRRSLNVTVVDTTGALVPDKTRGLLTPYGTELRPFRGVRYSDGTTELAPLGVFHLAKVDPSESSSGEQEIKVEAFDPSRRVIRDKFIRPYTIAPGTPIIAVIQRILARTYPNLEYDIVPSPMVTTQTIVYDAGDDAWEAVTELADSMGAEIYFSTVGRVVIAPPNDVDANPAPEFTYIEGPGCTLTSLSSTLSDEPGFNGVVIIGESPGDDKPPVRAEAWDEEPTSPTYRHGPYGEVPLIIRDSNIKSTFDAVVAAKKRLNELLGFVAQLSITSVVNPALEAGDVVLVQRKRSKVDDLFTIDSFKVPLLGTDTQTLQIRSKRRRA